MLKGKSDVLKFPKNKCFLSSGAESDKVSVLSGSFSCTIGIVHANTSPRITNSIGNTNCHIKPTLNLIKL